MKQEDGRSLSAFSLFRLGGLRSIVVDLDGVTLSENIGSGPEVSRGHLGRAGHLERALFLDDRLADFLCCDCTSSSGRIPTEYILKETNG